MTRRTERPSRLPVLGLDIGGVLADRIAENSATSFIGDRPLETPVVPGAFEAVALLADRFGGRVHFISVAGRKVAPATMEWLRHHRVLESMGLDDTHVHFCRHRPEKGPICKALGVSHYVDDRSEVIETMRVRHRFLFTGGLGANPIPTRAPSGVRLAADWPSLVTMIEKTVPR